MLIEHSSENQVNIVKLTGRLTASKAKQFRSNLKDASRGTCPKLVLDMADLTFVDSTGLGILAGWLQKVKSEEGEMVLLNPTKEIRILLELTRLDQIFTIHKDRDAAIHSFH